MAELLKLRKPGRPHSPPSPRQRAARHSKPTTCISSSMARRYEDALQYASDHEAELGLSIVHVTVWWGGTRLAGQKNYSPTIKHTLDHVRRWMRHRREPFWAWWVQEHAETKGLHWHLALHCPLEHRKPLDSYLRSLIPKTANGAVKIERPNYSEPCPCGRKRDWRHLVGSYMLKGGSEPVRIRNGIDRCAASVFRADQGSIAGKRIGFPRDLARRQRALMTSANSRENNGLAAENSTKNSKSASAEKSAKEPA